ncbi:MAG: uroporphyrinogen-III synthase [Bacteroidetes bacterium]|nr:uroporphyrinogen-III synthase [Bacteroidota bacterium]
MATKKKKKDVVKKKKVVKLKKPIKKVAKKKAVAVKIKKTAKKLPSSTKKSIKVKTITTTPPETIIEKKLRKNAKKPPYVPIAKPTIEVSNYPKNKIKTVLISQPKPVDPDKNPYVSLSKRYNLNLNFRHFIKVEPLSGLEFRQQRIEILAHGAVIMTSRLAIDHYFRLCNEMRVTVPDGMKFFCISEQIAYYLQKYIQFRKRKIFFGHGTIVDLVDVIRKNKDEKFLLPVSDVHKEQIVDFLDELNITYTKGTFYKTVSANLSDIKTLNQYDLLVFFTSAGLKSLKHNFPNFKQGSTRIAAFGHSVALKVKELGYRLDIFAPNPRNPSMSGAIETYIKESNKR